jgi:hypothetical protein
VVLVGKYEGMRPCGRLTLDKKIIFIRILKRD